MSKKKLTKSRLRQLVREEVQNVLSEVNESDIQELTDILREGIDNSRSLPVEYRGIEILDVWKEEGNYGKPQYGAMVRTGGRKTNLSAGPHIGHLAEKILERFA